MTGVVNCRRVARRHDESTYYVNGSESSLYNVANAWTYDSGYHRDENKLKVFDTALISSQIKIRYIARWENDVFQLIEALKSIFFVIEDGYVMRT